MRAAARRDAGTATVDTERRKEAFRMTYARATLVSNNPLVDYRTDGGCSITGPSVTLFGAIASVDRAGEFNGRNGKPRDNRRFSYGEGA